jgi:molybdopterin molybdotransferase
VSALEAEPVALEEAAGRVLAADARAAVDLPPFPSSAMDGFAVRAADTPGTLPVVARSAAGLPAGRELGAGEAIGISTGGVVPEGADAVIPIEYVVEYDNRIEIGTPVEPGANVRPRGGDIRAGQVVCPAGTRLGAGQLGALAAAGLGELPYVRRPRVAVLTTGTELRRPGEPLGPGEVYEANGLMLAAALASAGASVERLPAIQDDLDAHRAAIARGLEADMLVTSGGVSVGRHDLVRPVLAELGVEEVFWRVAVKPGKPISFSVRGSALVFGLPGNPVSALVGFELFVRPAVLALQGAAEPLPRFEPGRLARAVRRSAGRDELVRARSEAGDGEVVVDPLDGQDSHMIASAAKADVLVFVPHGDGELAAGAAVRYLRLGV